METSLSGFGRNPVLPDVDRPSPSSIPMNGFVLKSQTPPRRCRVLLKLRRATRAAGASCSLTPGECS